MSYRQFDVVKTSPIASYTANNPKFDSQDARISIPPHLGVTNRYAITATQFDLLHWCNVTDADPLTYMTTQFDFSYIDLLSGSLGTIWSPVH